MCVCKYVCTYVRATLKRLSCHCQLVFSAHFANLIVVVVSMYCYVNFAYLLLLLLLKIVDRLLFRLQPFSFCIFVALPAF